jgi:thymidylate synthase (FAD)
MSKVKLISFTSPSEDIQNNGINDIKDIISFCARVSNPSNQFNTETSDKLLNYLLKNKHISPFEMANICLEIETTRDIARQILRHRSMNFQEFSQRYNDPVKELEFTLREARLQDNKNRQNSIQINDIELQNQWNEKQQNVIDMAKESYSWAISKGIAKEQARSVLPEGNTLTRMYVNGNIRSWIHYLESRLDSSTQKEHRDVAQKVLEQISQVFPLIFNVISK